tara:strand:- start:1498 stop:2373 length:876 start_codon:yes stop_codon:yes gene_type:complete
MNINGFSITTKIGKGSFGEVFVATNANGQKFAAKLEPRRNKNGKRRRGPSQLEYENRVYELLKEGDGIPRVYKFFVKDDYNIMIMQLLGRSIQSVFERNGKILPLDTVIAVGIRILHHLLFVHNQGFIHRDIKPQNILLASKPTRNPQIYLIDFGLSKRYWINDSHIPYRDNKRGLTGTPRYCSIGSHLGVEQSRRDDLESLGYVLIYLSKGKLPWMGLGGRKKMRSSDSTHNKHQQILTMKQNISTLELCEGLPHGIYQFVKTVRKLKFDEKPPYDSLYNMLLSAYTNSR